MLGKKKVLWLTPHATVARDDYGAGSFCSLYLRDFYTFLLRVDSKSIHVFAHSLEAFSEIADVVRRLLLADVSEVNELEFKSGPYPNIIDGRRFFDAESPAYLMEQCQSLKALKLEQIALDEDHIRVLGDISRPGLEIELRACRITGATAAVLAQVLGRNQGPTKLFACDTENILLADGLRGNSRLKSLALRIYNDRGLGNQELIAFASAIQENKGLVDLKLLHDFVMSDETWDAVCDSLKAHPTLQILSLGRCDPHLIPLAPAALKSRIQALVNMLKLNTVMHTMTINVFSSDELELCRRSVDPYIETNRFRPRLLAIQKTRPIAYRAKVLGRALLAARTDANILWMLLSGNTEVAFPSTNAMTIPATDLPMPATALAIAASNAATSTPTAGQKRRAHP
jgi:hypothetical protein